MRGIDNELDQSLQIVGACAENLHRLPGPIACLRGTGLHHQGAMWAADALLASEDVKGFVTGVTVNGRGAPGRTTRLDDAKKVTRCGNARDRPHLGYSGATWR